MKTSAILTLVLLFLGIRIGFVGTGHEMITARVAETPDVFSILPVSNRFGLEIDLNTNEVKISGEYPDNSDVKVSVNKSDALSSTPPKRIVVRDTILQKVPGNIYMILNSKDIPDSDSETATVIDYVSQSIQSITESDILGN